MPTKRPNKEGPSPLPPSTEFLEAAERFHKTLYALTMERYESAYERFVGPGKRRRLPRAATKDAIIDTRRLALMLLACNASHHVREHGQWPSQRTIQSAGSRFPNRAWRLASPFVVAAMPDQIVRPAKRRWLRERNPLVQIYSMSHQSLRLSSDPSPLDVWVSLSRLWLRLHRVSSAILKEAGCGGSWWWDIVPKRPGRNPEAEKVLIHAHLLLEPYVTRDFDLRRVHPLVEAAWAGTQDDGLLKKVVVCPVRREPRDLMSALLYVHGLPRIYGARTSKVLKPFTAPRDLADGEPSDNGGSTFRPDPPSPDQLRLMLALYTFPGPQPERWLGVWDHYHSGPGKMYAKRPADDVNSPAVAAEFKALTYPRRWRRDI